MNAVAVAELTEVRKESGFTFPDKLVDQNSPTAKHYDALLRGLTHKLNNLLAVIQGFSSLVLMQDDLDEMSKENLQHMKDAAGNASDLGERVLPAGGCSRIDLVEVALSDSVPLLLTRVRGQVEGAQLPLHTSLDQNLPSIMADPDKLRLIVDELVKNAIEAAGSRGEVTVEVLVPGGSSGRVDFFVRNTGSEIPESKIADVFEPFYTTKDSTHMGIGLTTAAVLAGRMGMDLGVQSGDDMTSFWLRAPVVG